MGMFDYLHCEYPLPVDGANGLVYQTKDTPSQFIDHYKIKADGTLWHEDYEIEDRSDPNAEGLARIAGMMTRVNPCWMPVSDFIGEIRFYYYSEKRYLKWSAYFKDGKLVDLNLVKDE